MQAFGIIPTPDTFDIVSLMISLQQISALKNAVQRDNAQKEVVILYVDRKCGVHTFAFAKLQYAVATCRALINEGALSLEVKAEIIDHFMLRLGEALDPSKNAPVYSLPDTSAISHPALTATGGMASASYAHNGVTIPSVQRLSTVATALSTLPPDQEEQSTHDASKSGWDASTLEYAEKILQASLDKWKVRGRVVSPLSENTMAAQEMRALLLYRDTSHCTTWEEVVACRVCYEHEFYAWYGKTDYSKLVELYLKPAVQVLQQEQPDLKDTQISRVTVIRLAGLSTEESTQEKKEKLPLSFRDLRRRFEIALNHRWKRIEEETDPSSNFDLQEEDAQAWMEKEDEKGGSDFESSGYELARGQKVISEVTEEEGKHTVVSDDPASLPALASTAELPYWRGDGTEIESVFKRRRYGM